MKRLLSALRSVRLAVILIVYLAATGIAASLVPQGRGAEYYASRYPAPFSHLIVASGFGDFFRSPLFLGPSALFFVNLTLCSIGRFARERRSSSGRYGPDILHLGLLVLILGSVASFSFRQTGLVQLARGDSARLPDGRILDLNDFTYRSYPDGRPRDWISTVRLSHGPTTLISAYRIRVNHPLRLGLLSIYQANSAEEEVLVLRDASGQERELAPGEITEAEGTRMLLLDLGGHGVKAKVRVQDAGGTRELELGPGDSVDGFEVLGRREVSLSGLEAVYDPGYPIVLVSLFLVALGLFLTFFQKLRDTMGASGA